MHRLIAAAAVAAACTPKAAAIRPPIGVPPTRIEPAPAIETEVVEWHAGRERVLARTLTMDASTWPIPTSRIWFVRPAHRDLPAIELAIFVGRAVALGVAGISLANCEAATDSTIAIPLASRPAALTFVDLSNTSITDGALRSLAALPNLEHAWLSGTRITDASLAQLSTVSSVTSVRVDEIGRAHV